jgi:hypothetical protein
MTFSIKGMDTCLNVICEVAVFELSDQDVLDIDVFITLAVSDNLVFDLFAINL